MGPGRWSQICQPCDTYDECQTHTQALAGPNVPFSGGQNYGKKLPGHFERAYTAVEEALHPGRQNSERGVGFCCPEVPKGPKSLNFRTNCHRPPGQTHMASEDSHFPKGPSYENHERGDEVKGLGAPEAPKDRTKQQAAGGRPIPSVECLVPRGGGLKPAAPGFTRHGHPPQTPTTREVMNLTNW